MTTLVFVNVVLTLAVLAALFNPKGILMSLASIKQDLADLRVVVQTNKDKDAAIVELINGYKARITDLQAQLDAAIAAGADPVALQEISDGIKAVRDDMDGENAAADVTLNT